MVINDYSETNDKAKVLLFTAPWCGPCKVIKQVIAKIPEADFGDVKLYAINVDKDAEMAKKYSVRSIPTMVFIKDGAVVDSVIGALNEDSIKSKVSEYLL